MIPAFELVGVLDHQKRLVTDHPFLDRTKLAPCGPAVGEPFPFVEGQKIRVMVASGDFDCGEDGRFVTKCYYTRAELADGINGQPNGNVLFITRLNDPRYYKPGDGYWEKYAIRGVGPIRDKLEHWLVQHKNVCNVVIEEGLAVVKILSFETPWEEFQEDFEAYFAPYIRDYADVPLVIEVNKTS